MRVDTNSLKGPHWGDPDYSKSINSAVLKDLCDEVEALREVEDLIRDYLTPPRQDRPGEPYRRLTRVRRALEALDPA